MNLSKNLRHWLDCGHRAHPGAHIGRAGGGMPHPSPLHPPFRPYGFMAAGVCRMLFDRQAGGCHTHPLAPPCPTVWVPGPSASAVCCCPTSGRGAFAACYSTGRRGDATPIPSHPPVRPCGFLVRRHLPYVAVRPAGGGMPHPSPLHPPFLPYGFMGRGRLPHVAVRQAGGGMPHPFPLHLPFRPHWFQVHM